MLAFAVGAFLAVTADVVVNAFVVTMIYSLGLLSCLVSDACSACRYNDCCGDDAFADYTFNDVKHFYCIDVVCAI